MTCGTKQLGRSRIYETEGNERNSRIWPVDAWGGKEPKRRAGNADRVLQVVEVLTLPIIFMVKKKRMLPYSSRG